jgi:hypothetical protein
MGGGPGGKGCRVFYATMVYIWYVYMYTTQS